MIILRKNKKYKVKYRKLNIQYIINFYLLNFTLLVFLMILNTVLISQFFITQLIILLIISFFAISFYLFYRSRYSISKIERFKAKLRNLIEYNKYYIENNKDNNLFYTVSLMFIFYKVDSSLIIEAHGFGAPYSLQNERLGKLLESALNLSITDIKNTHASHYTFIFHLDKPLRIDA